MRRRLNRQRSPTDDEVALVVPDELSIFFSKTSPDRWKIELPSYQALQWSNRYLGADDDDDP